MVRTLVLLAALMSLLRPGYVGATKDIQEGEPGFGVYLRIDPIADEANDYSLLIDSWSVRHGREVTGKVHVELPSGVELVSGEVDRTVHVSGRYTGPHDRRWTAKVRIARPGAYVLHASLRIPPRGGGQVDEGEYTHRSRVEGSSVSDRDWTEDRAEHISGGSRFRYGGDYMVLIADSERQKVHVDRDPEPIAQVEGVCDSCSAQVVPLVVTVDAAGRVSWIRPQPNWTSGVDPRTYAAALEAARQWTFRPALASGRPVSSWARVNVSVRLTAR